MPLNPEEVVNKRFSATKFRQGYDEEEVDEFLDEVVSELRRLNAENTELRSQLSTCESRVAALNNGSVAAPTVASPGAVAAESARPEQITRPAAAAGAGTETPAPSPEVPTAEPAAEEAPATAAPVTAAPVIAAPVTAAPVIAAPVTAAPVTAAPVAAAPSAPPSAPALSGDAVGAAGMLALAQRLHDEHVAAGRSRGDKLVSDAQERATRLVREAETTSRETLGALETRRKALETQVEELRSFEREYRSRLKTYLESQLRELETSGSPAGKDAATSPAAGSDGTAPRFPFGG